MANEMLERIAKVIDPQAWRSVNTTFDNSTQELLRLNSIDKARSVVLAMREPTAEMIDAGRINLGAGGELDNENLKEVWALMIDQA